jgi:hypothetical protein
MPIYVNPTPVYVNPAPIYVKEWVVYVHGTPLVEISEGNKTTKMFYK